MRVAIRSAAQQSLGEQGLHVSTAVGDQVDHDLMAVYPIQEPVRLEKYLSVLAQTQVAEFLRNGAALRACDKTACNVQQPGQHAVGVLDGVGARDVIVKLAKIDFGILGEKNLMRHLARESVPWGKDRVRPALASRYNGRSAVPARNDLTTSSRGRVLSLVTCALPSARIFSSASVLWVSS